MSVRFVPREVTLMLNGVSIVQIVTKIKQPLQMVLPVQLTVYVSFILFYLCLHRMQAMYAGYVCINDS